MIVVSGDELVGEDAIARKTTLQASVARRLSSLNVYVNGEAVSAHSCDFVSCLRASEENKTQQSRALVKPLRRNVTVHGPVLAPERVRAQGSIVADTA